MKRWTRQINITAEVNRIAYVEELEAEESRPFPFAYFVTIRNSSLREIVILGRKWVIQEKSGHKHVVEGEGIVGQKPVISLGRFFSYNSYHIVSCNSHVTGAYYGEQDNGEKFMIEIPSFVLKVPNWAKKKHDSGKRIY